MVECSTMCEVSYTIYINFNCICFELFRNDFSSLLRTNLGDLAVFDLRGEEKYVWHNSVNKSSLTLTVLVATIDALGHFETR